MPTAPAADAPTAAYKASCHCGAFTYTITLSPPLNDPSATVMECNCSICARNGYLFVYTPDERVKFTKGSIEEFKVRFHFRHTAGCFEGCLLVVVVMMM